MKYFVFHILLACICFSLRAQDPSYSQFLVNKVYLNPALAGSESGLSISSIYRNQWSGLPDAFNTMSLAVEFQSPKLSSGFGMQFMRDVSGDAALTTTSVGFTYAYIVRLTKTMNLHFGVGGNYSSQAIDGSRLIFSDQLHELDGVVGESNSNIPSEKISYFDLDAGLLMRFALKIGKTDIHNSVGFAMHHITQPEASFQNQDTRIPMRYALHYGSMIPIGHNLTKSRSSFYISPVFKWETQHKASISTAGSFFMFNPIYVGLFYQFNNFVDGYDSRTLIFNGGFSSTIKDVMEFIVGYSYDFNITGISVNGQGAHEVSLKLNFEDLNFMSDGRYNPKKGLGTKCYKFKGKGAVRLF